MQSARWLPLEKVFLGKIKAKEDMVLSPKMPLVLGVNVGISHGLEDLRRWLLLNNCNREESKDFLKRNVACAELIRVF